MSCNAQCTPTCFLSLNLLEFDGDGQAVGDNIGKSPTLHYFPSHFKIFIFSYQGNHASLL